MYRLPYPATVRGVSASEDFIGWLRARDDAELRDLLLARPELATPVPADMTALVGRAGSAGSVGRALDGLDAFTLAVVDALLVLPEPVTLDELHGALHGVEDGVDVGAALRAAIDRLRRLVLVWGEDTGLRPVAALRDVVVHPAGLGPPAGEVFAGYPSDRLVALAEDLDLPGRDPAAELAGLLADPDRLAALIEAAGADARAALDRLVWGPPTGSVSDAWRPVRIATAGSPIDALLARGLLAAAGEQSVVLPREVALYLRGGRLTHTGVRRPEPAGRAHDPGEVDRAAAAEAFTMVRAVEELLEFWGVAAPTVLRSGALGVRDLKRAATELDEPEWVVVLYAELARAAGLLAAGDAVDGPWLPTAGYDVWRAWDLPRRWAELVRAWLATTRVPGLVGERDDRDRPYNALGEGLDRGTAPRLRRQVLRVLADADAGFAPTPEAIGQLLDWRQPRRRGPLRDLVTGTTLREAERLGVIGRGSLAGYARAFWEGADTALGELAEALPEPVDHVLVQADLTAVAPGPLTQDLARELVLAADIESTGGATVYRFSGASIRRALDAGRSAAELLDFLERHSRTPLPQPVRYLVTDVARRHGRVRVGTASAYVRCDDPAALDELLADRRAGALRLHRIAPTVLVSLTSRAALVDTLRAAGYAPMAESFDGDLVVSRPDTHRAPDHRPSRAAPDARSVDATMIDAAVRAIRAGDEAATAIRSPVTAPGDAPPRSPAAATVEALSAAATAGQRVWIGYLDAQGQASSRIVEPARVEGGYLTAYDATRAAIHRFSLHRITGVATLDEETAPAAG